MLSVVLVLSGCGSIKTVYPTECAVVSNIKVEKADPEWLEEPKKPYTPTDDQVKNGASNSEILDITTRNNKELWQKDRDIRREWTKYYNRLVAKGVIK